ncbi:MAG: TIGR00266 family protein [Candidatus Hydrogenedens sp.]
MADKIDYQIYGDDMQAVQITLDPGESVFAEAGAMLSMDNGIEMQTSAGGLMKGLKRMLTDESFFITNFYNKGSERANVIFSAPYPGKIIPIDLKMFNGTFICQKDAFLCAAGGVEIAPTLVKKIGIGLFGGEGFILQKLTGDGFVFVHIGGTVLERELSAGETLRVDTGCIAGFASTVKYDIQFMSGFKNVLFGGEGLFLATLQGPGKIYLQTLPFSRLADRIISASRRNREETNVGGGGKGLGMLGRLIGGGDSF